MVGPDGRSVDEYPADAAGVTVTDAVEEGSLCVGGGGLAVSLSSTPPDNLDSRSVKLWIDADAAPRDVKDIVFRAATRLKMDTVLVANQRVTIPLGNPTVTSVWVAGGPDVADAHIADHAEAGDVAVTADIPLAAKLVEKQVVVIDPRGHHYTSENIGERLSMRDFMDGLRGAGLETGGPRAYSSKDKQAFASTLDRVLTRALRGR